jgi:heme exporter protein D
VKRSKKFKILAFLTCLLIILDGDYPGYEVFTETFYGLYVGPILQGLPSNPILYAIGVGIGPFLAAYRRKKSKDLRNQYEQAITMAGLPLVILATISFVIGIAGGGDFRIASWQARFLVCNLFWTIGMFSAVNKLDDVYRFGELLFRATLVKAALFLLIFASYYGGSKMYMGDKIEYVSSHSDSMYYAVGLGLTIFRILFDQQISVKIKSIGWAILLAMPLFINERRVAIIALLGGLVLSSFFIVPTLPPKIKKKLPTYGVIVAILGVVFWFSPLNPTQSIVNEQSAGEKDYRDIENYNLYNSIGRFPFLGIGFGVPFPQYEQLPDVIKFSEMLAWIPHNNFLMVWAFVGFAGPVSVGMYLLFGAATAVRTFRLTYDYRNRVIGLVAFLAVCQYGFYFWADIGMTYSQFPCLLIGACTKAAYLLESEQIKKGLRHA